MSTAYGVDINKYYLSATFGVNNVNLPIYSLTMPQKYVRKTYADYDKNYMAAAVEDVIKKRMKIATAAQLHSVNRTTIINFVKGKRLKSLLTGVLALIKIKRYCGRIAEEHGKDVSGNFTNVKPGVD